MCKNNPPEKQVAQGPDNDSGLPIHREEQFCAGLVGVPGLPGPPKGRYMGYSYSKPQKDAEQLETGFDGGRHHQTTMMLDILFGIFLGVAMSSGTCSLDHSKMSSSFFRFRSI